MTREETARLLAYLASAFPQATIRRENAEMYHRHLRDISYDEAMDAANVLIPTCEWFPSIAKIREEVETASGVLGPKVSVAWAEVCAKANKYGRSADLQFSHPAITKAVELIGWYNICMANIESGRFQFQQAYKQRDSELLSLQQASMKEIGSADF